MARDLLLELGTEEIPAGELDRALGELPQSLTSKLAAARLEFGSVTVWGTPRRVAVRVRGVAERQPDLEEELTGPPERVAFDGEGNPTKAAEKFAEKAGVTVAELRLVETPKGRYVTGRRIVAGQDARRVLPALLVEVIAGLGFRKSMRWGERSERFVRPLRWLLALFGDDLLPLEYAGVQSCNATRGHRFLAAEPVVVGSPDDYEDVLAQVHVMPDPAVRREAIQAQIGALEAAHDARVIPDEALLGEVANLVEWPTAVCGTFDESYLAVPREVIVSAMRGHQRYFAMERADGSLANRFITVLGTEVRDLDVAVRGNERVLAARLADARFFWDEDLKVGLAERAKALTAVVFQAKLGTVAEKALRLQRLGASLAPRFGADGPTVQAAAGLCKADLVTHMVGEFPDLQGVMGRHYALAAGQPPAVADAILEHYQPKGAGDELPPGAEGATLSAADRLDTLVGCIGAGLKPKGGGDPFGLRRASLGLLRVLLERKISVSLAELVREAAGLHTQVTADVDEVVAFLLERLRGLLGETATAELVQAVLSAGGDDPLDLALRVSAVQAFGQTDEYAALATTFRRMNILKQADLDLGEVQPDRFEADAERALHDRYLAARDQVTTLAAQRRYEDALAILAGLRSPVDDFFDKVKVMDDDAALRANRLALLAAVDALFRRVADFKMIAS
ncbi:MAG: glycine--tRNA ligase subunit beta [bacterium]